jgi:hypothetical protein
MARPPSRVNFSVSPERALNDQPVRIVVSGLEPGASVTLRAGMVDDFGRSWQAQAQFAAESDGTVDVAAMAPLRGSYTDIDAMGLFWSMVPTGGPMTGPRTKNALEPTRVTITVEADDSVTASRKIERLFVADGVERVPVRESGLVGTLFLPTGSGACPGVLVFSGSGGGAEEGRAALLASHGFAAFALAYFTAPTLPENLVDIPLEYFETGLEWMAQHPGVRADRIGVTGGSRGGGAGLAPGLDVSGDQGGSCKRS